jgi:hypothetical protein
MVVKPGILYFDVFLVVSEQFSPDKDIIPTLTRPVYGGKTWNNVI